MDILGMVLGIHGLPGRGARHAWREHDGHPANMMDILLGIHNVLNILHMVAWHDGAQHDARLAWHDLEGVQA
eukprot:9679749-Alexandrium_andersonii.AAC.1